MINEPTAATADKIPAEIKAFCTIEDAYPPDEKYDGAFIDAMREVTAWHMNHSPWYRRFAQLNGVAPGKLRTMDDVIALPPVHANFFKFHEIRSITLDQVAVHLTSSGTTGQKSQIFFDEFTIGHARRMVDIVMQARGVRSDIPANYLVNAYESYEGFKVGTSNTNQYLMRYAPVADQFWTLRYIGNGKHDFDTFGAIATLEQWSKKDTPVRIIGFPAFLHFILERMRNIDHPPFNLPEGSCVILGGGWKGHADKAIPKAKLYAAVEQQFGISSARIMETYGSVEHSVPYLDCEKHHLHQPAWSRVLIRDVKTLEPVEDGTPGFLSFISPYITSAPAHSVVMGDLAVRHAPGSCDCTGHPTAWFEVLGRAGTSSNKSCAAAASEFLKA